jgi:hypothetical protein
MGDAPQSALNALAAAASTDAPFMYNFNDGSGDIVEISRSPEFDITKPLQIDTAKFGEMISNGNMIVYDCKLRKILTTNPYNGSALPSMRDIIGRLRTHT